MSISRLFRRSSLGRRTTHLAIAVFPDESAAFQAYRLLHYYGISPEHLAIVGSGYSSPERVGLMRPSRIVLCKAIAWSTASGLVGIGLGVLLLFWQPQQPLLSTLITFSGVGALGGALLGTLFGVFGEGTTASVYRHHLRQGRYLLMMEGSEELVRWGQEVLSNYSAPSVH